MPNILNGTMFGDLDWPLNMSRGLSAIVGFLVMPSLLIGGDIKRWFCLTSFWPSKTKIGTEIVDVTRDSDTTFKVKGQGHQAALLNAALTCKAAAAVSVGTYSAWESTATLRLVVGARGAWASTEGGEGRGYTVSPRAQLVHYCLLYGTGWYS